MTWLPPLWPHDSILFQGLWTDLNKIHVCFRLKDFISKKADRERELQEKKRQKFKMLQESPRHTFQDESYFQQRELREKNLYDSLDKGMFDQVFIVVPNNRMVLWITYSVGTMWMSSWDKISSSLTLFASVVPSIHIHLLFLEPPVDNLLFCLCLALKHTLSLLIHS